VPGFVTADFHMNLERDKPWLLEQLALGLLHAACGIGIAECAGDTPRFDRL
jgi:hypothetical protein